MNQTPAIVTDEHALNVMVWLICGLITIIGILAGFLVNKILSEVKAGRLERTEFTNALNHKFRALNAYVRSQDRTAVVHSEKLSNLESEHQEYKKKTDQHAIQLSKHESEINSLKESRP